MISTFQRKFLSLACRLLPENLSRDGETNKTQIVKRYNKIKSEWDELEKECGKKITEDDVWGWNIK